MAQLVSSPIAAQPPPPLPNMPDVSSTLSNYLRTFSLWCRNGFAAKLDAHTALPGVLVRATDASTGAVTPFVYLVGVTVTVTGGVASAPTITFTAMPLGSGSP
jgi:hypothetical protein